MAFALTDDPVVIAERVRETLEEQSFRCHARQHAMVNQRSRPDWSRPFALGIL